MENRDTRVDEIEEALDLPMALLAILALAVIIVDLTVELTPRALLTSEIVFWLVWGAFVLEYLVKLLVSENRRRFVVTRWVDLAIALVPFLRILRVLRLARVTRSLALLRLFLFGRRGMGRLGITLSRRIGYLAAISAFVVIFGAVGAFLLEVPARGSTIGNFGDALWWSSQLVIGQEASNLFPVTAGGRVLGVFLLGYSAVVFAFLAASLASYLLGKQEEEIGTDRHRGDAE
jgi:voltage-gated potassium channel